MIIPSIRSISVELLPWKDPGIRGAMQVAWCGVWPWRNKADMQIGEGSSQDLPEQGYLATGVGGWRFTGGRDHVLEGI